MPIKKKEGLIELFPEFQPMRVKYKDVLDFKAFYEALREWLLENDWKDSFGDLDHWETYYGERIDRNGAKEIWIQWRPMKNAKDSKYLNYYLDFNFHCLGMTKVEVVKDGQKVKVDKGEMELIIKAFIEKGYDKEFEKNALLKPLLKIFQKRIYQQKFEERKKELHQETYALQNFIKHWLKLKRYLPYEDTAMFFESKAWPSHLKE